MPVQRGFQTQPHKLLPDPVGRRKAGVERTHDVAVRPARTLLAFIRLQQNPRPRRRGRRMASLGKHLLQLVGARFPSVGLCNGAWLWSPDKRQSRYDNPIPSVCQFKAVGALVKNTHVAIVCRPDRGIFPMLRLAWLTVTAGTIKLPTR